ncbi:MAG: glucose 1-dehydrogenase [Albidovulum sp.]|nr:glucose 1-dehydrogenase [Albidovulum sp.]
MKLAGKTALITGGGSGFGAGIARKFSEEGATVMIADVDSASAEEVAGDIGGFAVEADISSGDSVERMAGEAANRLGDIDILVNNAGITHLPTPLDEIPEDEFDRVFAVNCKSVYLTSKHFVPKMKSRGGGAILNIASTAGVSPRRNLSWYNASKGWMITATLTMAIELAEHGIRVNALTPVAGETPLLKRFLGEDTPEMRSKFLATIPLGRFSAPEDIGNAACFLCSDEASLITGAALNVDGGRCI